MEIAVLVVAMIVVGLLIGALAGVIWKDERPIGVPGDYLAAVATTVVVGLLDWLVIPAMGFSPTLTYIGVVLEPPVSALLVLWLIKKARE